MPIIKVDSKRPTIHCSYIAPGAMVVGEIVLRRGSSVWFNAVLRGDQQLVEVGVDANIQDLVLLHAEHYPTVIGRGSSIGHGAIVHGATVGEFSLVGMGAVLNEGVKIGNNCLVASGAVIPPRVEIPHNSVVMGNPGQVVRQIRESELQMIMENTAKYRAKAERYLRTATTSDRGEHAWMA